MTRVTRGFVAKNRRKRVLKLAKGFRGSHSVLFRTAQQRVLRALSSAYRDRRLYKRNIRSLWIRRLNSFLRDGSSELALGKQTTESVLHTAQGPMQPTTRSYSVFIHQLKKSNVLLNRKVLSQLAIFDPVSMSKISHFAARS